uniref:Uncharacterized protein n=1 Tax=Arcella intermedia TaxID=1963864 RepID=A0A6B2LHF9_9EUKA
MFVLAGHTSSVTCFLLLGEVLVSGSTDKSLRFWNLKKGECILHLPNSHESSIKCLVDIGDEKFCSGGNDRFLRIWSYQGTLIGVIERQEEENLHCLLAISNKRIVTGSNSSLLHTYNTETMKFISFFTNHRESVRCLVNINEELFASASLDGVIVVWKSDLSPCRTLSYPEKFDSKFYSCSVNDLLVLQEQLALGMASKSSTSTLEIK